MGIRSVIGVIQGGEWRIANYGRCDGDPRDCGCDILAFLRRTDLNVFAEKLSNCRLIDDRQIQCYYKDMGFPVRKDGSVLCDYMTQFEDRYPNLAQNQNANILELVMQSTGPIELCDVHSFMDDFGCDYSYVIDLDAMVFRGYECGKHLIAEYPLTDLPTDEQFVQAYDE